MLILDNVTLIALTGKDYEAHGRALDLSCKGVKYREVKLIGRPDIQSIDDWNRVITYDLHKYIDTDFALLVHADGYVINPQAWKKEFTDYDYIGAPWPLPSDSFSYRDEVGDIVRVGNSVSLRSKRLMERVALFPWKSYYGNTNEDGFISVHHHNELQKEGYKFAEIDIAKYFSKEHSLPENEGIETFCFHSL